MASDPEWRRITGIVVGCVYAEVPVIAFPNKSFSREPVRSP